MERHLSTGTATIVALMAVHRIASACRTTQADAVRTPAPASPGGLCTPDPAVPRVTQVGVAINSHLQRA